MKTKRLLITILALACLIALVLLAVKGLEIDSVERLQEIVINSGVWGILLFILFNWLFMLGQFLPTAIVKYCRRVRFWVMVWHIMELRLRF